MRIVLPLKGCLGLLTLIFSGAGILMFIPDIQRYNNCNYSQEDDNEAFKKLNIRLQSIELSLNHIDSSLTDLSIKDELPRITNHKPQLTDLTSRNQSKGNTYMDIKKPTSKIKNKNLSQNLSTSHIAKYLKMKLKELNYVKQDVQYNIKQKNSHSKSIIPTITSTDSFTSIIKDTARGLIEINNTKEEKVKLRSKSSQDSKHKKLYGNVLCDNPDKELNTKILSYSLFGKESEKIGRFIADVAREALTIDFYRDFNIRIYVSEAFSENSRNRLRSLYSNLRFCNVRKLPIYGDISNTIGTVWRFIPMADSTVDVFCSRDLDSPLLQREADAVAEWLSTDKLMHVMRDREVHNVPIMGGMWCFRPKMDIQLGRQFVKTMLQVARYPVQTTFDQVLLMDNLWPKVRDRTLQHDAYFCEYFIDAKPFPTRRNEFFVGCTRDCSVWSKKECPLKCRPKDHKDWKYC